MLLLKTEYLSGNFTKIYNTKKGPQQCEPFFYFVLEGILIPNTFFKFIFQ